MTPDERNDLINSNIDDPLITPERLKLLESFVNIQGQALRGCLIVFEELTGYPDEVVADGAKQSVVALKLNRAVLDAMIEQLNHTHH